MTWKEDRRKKGRRQTDRPREELTSENRPARLSSSPANLQPVRAHPDSGVRVHRPEIPGQAEVEHGDGATVAVDRQPGSLVSQEVEPGQEELRADGSGDQPSLPIN